MSEIELDQLGTMPSATTKVNDVSVVVAYQPKSENYLITLYGEGKGRPTTVAIWKDGDLIMIVDPKPDEEAILSTVVSDVIPELAKAI